MTPKTSDEAVMCEIAPGSIEARVLANVLGSNIEMLLELRSDEAEAKQYLEETGVPMLTGSIILRGILASLAVKSRPHPWVRVSIQDGQMSATGPAGAVSGLMDRYVQMAATQRPTVNVSVESIAIPAAGPSDEQVKRKYRKRASPGTAASKTEKLCKMCGGVRPLDEFNKNRHSPDGRQGYCRTHQAEFSKKKARDKKNIAQTQPQVEELIQAETEVLVDEQEQSMPARPSTDQENLPSQVTVSVDTDNFVYSKLVKCPKCFAGSVRLRRRIDADPDRDVWIHDRGSRQIPCTMKIAHHQIKEDRGYAGGVKQSHAAVNQ